MPFQADDAVAMLRNGTMILVPYSGTYSRNPVVAGCSAVAEAVLAVQGPVNLEMPVSIYIFFTVREQKL